MNKRYALHAELIVPFLIAGLCVAAGVLAMPAPTRADEVLYVAPADNDSWPGSLESASGAGDETPPAKLKTGTKQKSPLVTIDLLCRETPTSTPVRVRGVVTGTFRNRLYVRDGTGSLRILRAADRNYQPGDQLEIEGTIVEGAFRRELAASRFTLLGKEAPPKPLVLTGEPGRVEDYEAELITLEVEFLGATESKVFMTLHARTKNLYMDARLSKSCELPAKLVPNAIVKLTGFCELQSTFPNSKPRLADFMHLNLMGAEGIQIIRVPEWWRSRILLGVMAAALGLGVVTLTWIALLRRQVARQTRLISEQIEKTATLAERQRIARDLHDEIEQEMTGISFQLDNVEANFTEVPEKAHSALVLARQMLRHCREETRNTIRDLRDSLIDHFDLSETMRNRLQLLTAEGAAQLVFEMKGNPMPMDAVTKTHFLRMAQEAATNAVRHAAASEIRVELLYQPGTVTLTIRDNGRGFDVSAGPPRGHFGLAGMQERAGKINAALQIESVLGKGTTVQVVLPLG